MHDTTAAGVPTARPTTPAAPNAARGADATRQRLLTAARRRFAMDGYGSTTVRDIATEAGVNVALINRYFGSKEGLFEACLTRTAQEFDTRAEPGSTIEHLVDRMVQQVTGEPGGDASLQMLLLVRSSGDDRADRIRRETLRSFTERLADAVGWHANDPATTHLLLRAQVVIATALGIVMVRAATGLEPMTSTAADELAGPLRDVVTALLRDGTE